MSENKNMLEEAVQDSTTVEQVDVNIDEIFGMPGAESVMLPEDEKQTVFSQTKPVDTTFIDKPAEETTTNVDSKVGTEEVVQPEITQSEVQDTIDELDEAITAQEEGEAGTGRRKTDKSGLVDLAAKMIEEGTLFGFDDDKPIEEYSAKDFTSRVFPIITRRTSGSS
jgi:hypothetical protein